MDPFSQRVYALVRRVPAGKVATYGQLAALSSAPRSARAVGAVLAACRDPSVPCHRVVDRLGGVKSAFDTFAPGTQRALLESEGVNFTRAGRVDLAAHLWDPWGSG